MKDIVLIKPNIKYYNEINEFKESLLLTNDFVGTCELKKYDIKEWLRFIKKQESALTCRKLFVPESVFMLYDKVNNKVIGMVSLRHYLNDNYKEIGGHIGYVISPLYRNKGYGNMILSLIINKCKKFNLDELLLVTHINNEYSKKVILKNKGILKDIYPFHDDVYERYIIRL